MDDVWWGMELAAKAMTAKIANDRAALTFGIRLDCIADVASCGAGAYDLYAFHEGIVCDVEQAGGLGWNFANRDCAAGVSVPAIQDEGDINVENAAGF